MELLNIPELLLFRSLGFTTGEGVYPVMFPRTVTRNRLPLGSMTYNNGYRMFGVAELVNMNIFIVFWVFLFTKVMTWDITVSYWTLWCVDLVEGRIYGVITFAGLTSLLNVFQPQFSENWGGWLNFLLKTKMIGEIVIFPHERILKNTTGTNWTQPSNTVSVVKHSILWWTVCSKQCVTWSRNLGRLS